VVGLDNTSLDEIWRVFVFSGSTSRPSTAAQIEDAAMTITGGTTDTALALSMGDSDGDGQMDLLIGSPYNGEVDYQAGAAYLFRGRVFGEYMAAEADAKWTASVDYQWFGYGADLGGDVNGDGYGDVLLGSPNSLGGPGWVHLFFGSGL